MLRLPLAKEGADGMLVMGAKHIWHRQRATSRSGAGGADCCRLADRGAVCVQKLQARTEIPLKNKEYELPLLMRHPGQVFSREKLYELIWGLESMGDKITVAVHMAEFVIKKRRIRRTRGHCKQSGAWDFGRKGDAFDGKCEVFGRKERRIDRNCEVCYTYNPRINIQMNQDKTAR